MYFHLEITERWVHHRLTGLLLGGAATILQVVVLQQILLQSTQVLQDVCPPCRSSFALWLGLQGLVIEHQDKEL